MRKLINIWFLLPALLLVWAVSATATTKQVTLSYNTSDFTYSTEGGVTSIVPSDLMAVYGTDTLAPALPRYGVSILIAPTQTYDTVTVTQSQTLVQSGVYIGPNTLPVPNDGTPPPSSPSLVNYAASEYPASGSEVVYTGCHDIDGYRVLTFSVSPFRYDATNGDLYLRTALTLNISLSCQQQAPAIGGVPQPHHGGANMREVVKDVIANKEDIANIYDYTFATHPIDSARFKYEYLIVTADSLKDSYMPLVRWKTMKGVRAGIVTVEEIDAAYTVSRPSLPLKIKCAIRDFYNGSGNGLRFVLLGGNHNIVPSMVCDFAIINPEDNDTISGTTPCDYYYSCLNRLYWGTNLCDTISAINDSIDFIPNMSVTRFPATSNADVVAFVNKIIEYEAHPNIDNWNNNILLCGGKHFGYRINNQIYSESHYKGLVLYNNYIQNYMNSNMSYFYDTGNNLGYNSLTYNYFQDELNKGYGFVMEDSHGTFTLLSLTSFLKHNDKIGIIQGYDFSDVEGFGYYSPSASQYSYTRLQNLNNKVYTIFVTNACRTNLFTKHNCFAEIAMRYPNTGIIAYLGSSYSGLARYPKSEFGSANQFSALFFEDLLTSKWHRFGESVTAAKIKNLMYSTGVDLDTTSNYYKYEFKNQLLTINPLGDPEMPVYIDRPKSFDNVLVSYNPNGVLAVNLGLDSCCVCIMSLADFGDSYYRIIDDIHSVVIDSVPINCSVCFTKPGYIPYIVNLNESPLFIQDEMFTGKHHIVSNQIFIGSDVTCNKPQGNVNILNGSTTFQSSDGVVIKNDFKVNKGAEFKIIIKK